MLFFLFGSGAVARIRPIIIASQRPLHSCGHEAVRRLVFCRKHSDFWPAFRSSAIFRQRLTRGFTSRCNFLKLIGHASFIQSVSANSSSPSDISPASSLKQNQGEDDILKFATEYHAPVLWRGCVDALVTDFDLQTRFGDAERLVFVDGTLGGGGHSTALLHALKDVNRKTILIGIDQDRTALFEASKRLQKLDFLDPMHSFESIHGNFGSMDRLLLQKGIGPGQVHGILLDLGMSSHHIDNPERGFSFQRMGPLDMRMDRSSSDITAEQIVNEWSADDIRKLLVEYGEESRAAPIARNIVQSRPFSDTVDLADAVKAVVPYKEQIKCTARVFQALRIAVNNELEVLERVLDTAHALLAPGGRLAVISYHSLEDRRVKHMMKYGNLAGAPVQDKFGTLISPWRLVHKKPITASEAEVKVNSRARSARLRVAEKVPIDWAVYEEEKSFSEAIKVQRSSSRRRSAAPHRR